MASYAKDVRCVQLAKVLGPLLERSSPEGAGGYAGSFQAYLPNEAAEQLGGVDLVRAALRRAARELGWTFRTYGSGGGPEDAVALIGIYDTCEVPEPYTEVVERDRRRQMRAAVERVAAGRRGESAPDTEPLRGTPAVHTKELVAALFEHGLVK